MGHHKDWLLPQGQDTGGSPGPSLSPTGDRLGDSPRYLPGDRARLGKDNQSAGQDNARHRHNRLVML